MENTGNDIRTLSKDSRPRTLLTDEETAAGNIKFVELVKARQKLIEEAKKAKAVR